MKYLRHIEEGTLEEYNLTCPWHDGVFDVRDTTVSDQLLGLHFIFCSTKIKETTDNVHDQMHDQKCELCGMTFATHQAEIQHLF
jgi:hypothetical protein